MTRVVLALLCACLVLASCGGDEDEGSDEFLQQANAICANYGPKIAAISPPFEDIDEWGAVGADIGDQLEASVNELRLLNPSDELAEQYSEWVALRADLLTEMRGVQDAGNIHDEAGVEAGLASITELQTQADELAEKLGLTDCSPTGITVESP
ncbi:MAG TPA: hypothetical protein VFG85_07645 [Gaiellaceae bacterium]|jgi:hypothetical protein|nr:hypothetical protein [Gaiellaceae bacterium]